MRVPNAARAEVDIRKLRDYCLSPDHEVGKHKARVFAAALNMGIDESSVLRQELLDAVRTNDAVPGVFDRFGQRYVVSFGIEHDGRSARIESVWIIGDW